MIINLLFNFSIVIFVAIIITLSKHFFPVEESFEHFSYSSTSIVKYARFEKLSGPMFLFFCIGMLFVWHALLQNLSILQSNLHGNNVFIFSAESADLLLLAFFLSLTSSIVLVSLLFRLILRGQFSSYIQFSNYRAKFNVWRATNTVSFFSFFIFAIISLLATNSYIRLTPSEVVINRFFSFRESKYNYESQIFSIEQVHLIEQTDTKSIDIIYFLVNFTDGTRWRTNRYSRNAIPKLINDMILYISHRSSLPIQIVEE